MYFSLLYLTWLLLFLICQNHNFYSQKLFMREMNWQIMTNIFKLGYDVIYLRSLNCIMSSFNKSLTDESRIHWKSKISYSFALSPYKLYFNKCQSRRFHTIDTCYLQITFEFMNSEIQSSESRNYVTYIANLLHCSIYSIIKYPPPAVLHTEQYRMFIFYCLLNSQKWNFSNKYLQKRSKLYLHSNYMYSIARCQTCYFISYYFRVSCNCLILWYLLNIYI